MLLNLETRHPGQELATVNRGYVHTRVAPDTASVGVIFQPETLMEAYALHDYHYDMIEAEIRQQEQRRKEEEKRGREDDSKQYPRCWLLPPAEAAKPGHVQYCPREFQPRSCCLFNTYIFCDQVGNSEEVVLEHVLSADAGKTIWSHGLTDPSLRQSWIPFISSVQTSDLNGDVIASSRSETETSETD